MDLIWSISQDISFSSLFSVAINPAWQPEVFYLRNKTKLITVTIHKKIVYLIYEKLLITNNFGMNRLELIFNKYPVHWLTFPSKLRCIYRALKRKLKDHSKCTLPQQMQGFFCFLSLLFSLESVITLLVFTYAGPNSETCHLRHMLDFSIMTIYAAGS